MRDLTKSVTSYAWAMSVFWTQQMFNFVGLGGSGSWDRSTRAFTNVTEATADEMGDTVRALFRGGDTLQRGMVDLFLAPLSLGNWCGGSRDGARRGVGQETEGARGAADGRGTRREGVRTGAYSDEARRSARAPGWVDTTARAAAAGVDIVQAAADTTAHAARRAVGEVIPPAQPSVPPAGDPSLGWGPMPR